MEIQEIDTQKIEDSLIDTQKIEDSLITTHENEYTPEQKEKVKQLRERVESILLFPDQNEDRFLIKWLIARNYNLDDAETMLRKHIRFLKANGMDKMTEDFKPSEIFHYFHTAFLGYDKEGSIIRILHVGASDIRGLASAVSQTECLKYCFYILTSDYLKQKRERQNDTLCDKQVYVLDLKGLSWRSVIQRTVVNRAYMLLKSYEANHPERLKIAYVVNVPNFFSFIFSWLKTVLPESIISKIEVFSEEDCQYSSALAKKIDPTILPASAGGCRKDPDGNPDCPSLYPKPLGSPIPEELLPTNHLEALQNDPEAKRVTVWARGVFIVEKLITKPNSTLLWDFQTLDNDIRMGLRYKTDENAESERIIPVHRVDSHFIPESGNFICENPGIYEIVFDNTYSWMTKKELLIKVNVQLPTDNDDDDGEDDNDVNN